MHSVTVTARVKAGADGEEDVHAAAGSVSVPFVSGFALTGAPKTLVLSGRRNTTSLQLVGSTRQVVATWGLPNALSVQATSEDLSSYRISTLRMQQSFTDTLVFTLASTGQQVSIPVR